MDWFWTAEIKEQLDTIQYSHDIERNQIKPDTNQGGFFPLTYHTKSQGQKAWIASVGS